jgi:hypothetical protein
VCVGLGSRRRVCDFFAVFAMTAVDVIEEDRNEVLCESRGSAELLLMTPDVVVGDLRRPRFGLWLGRVNRAEYRLQNEVLGKGGETNTCRSWMMSIDESRKDL